MENLARQLLADVRDLSPSPHCLDQAIGACERFRLPLTKLAGPSGFSSLLSRALALAKRRSKCLDELQVGVDGFLIVVKGDVEKLETAGSGQEGAIILVSELLALLVALIGEPLTLSLVREQWPALSSGSAIRSAEEKHE